MLTDIPSIRAGKDGTPRRVRPAGGSRTPTPVLLARVGLCLQLVWLIGFSVVEFLHDDLGYDFAIFFQAGWKISHGQLDPYSSTKGFPFWQNHGEAMMWLLAPLARIPPYGMWLLVAQDVATVALGWVLVDWVAHLARSDRWISALPGSLAVSVAALAFLGNPWVYLADAWDFHLQVFAVLALLLAARSFVDGRVGAACAWTAVVLAAGDVAGTYVAGLGVTLLLLSRRDRSRRRIGGGLLIAGLAWTALLSAVHANLGSDLASGYGYLAGPGTHSLLSILRGAVTHPTRLVQQVGGKDLFVLLTVLPGAGLGLLSPFGAVPLITLFVDGAHSGIRFAKPFRFQSWPVWPFGVVGSIWVLGRSRHVGSTRMIWKVFLGVTLLSSVLAAWIGFPYYPLFLSVPGASATQIRADMSAIPSKAEVVVCEGIAGWFGDRPNVTVIVSNPVRVPLPGGDVYFVLSPHVGGEPTADTESVIDVVRSELHASVVSHRHGVWVLRWTPPPGQRSLLLRAHVPDFSLT